MRIKEILKKIEQWAPPALQESYDNCGLLTGMNEDSCTGVLCTLDVTDAVLEEAINHSCNLIIAHHPLIFKPLKHLRGSNATNKILIKAIKYNIAIYALHTNLDNVLTGVNQAFAKQAGLKEDTLNILHKKAGQIAQLTTYTPIETTVKVEQALFEAGAGSIGKYEECSFVTTGEGSFKPMAGSNPVIGEAGGMREKVKEAKIEVVFPLWRQPQVLAALRQAHPYEEIAYQVVLTQNPHQDYGSGIIGNVEHAMSEATWLAHLKKSFNLQVLRHSKLVGKSIHKVALCGGAGSFLIKNAIAAGADAFVTADLKYHDFFEADGKLLLVDIGHGESEHCTINLIADFLTVKFPTFAVLKSRVNTNPVYYL